MRGSDKGEIADFRSGWWRGYSRALRMSAEFLKDYAQAQPNGADALAIITAATALLKELEAQRVHDSYIESLPETRRAGFFVIEGGRKDEKGKP